MACTTILVGKNASYDGSTLMARNEDSGAGFFTPKKLTVVLPEQQPRKYKSVISGVEIDLPDDPMRYTAMPNALPDEGIWGEAGFNECNIAMSETETLTSNPRVLAADPLTKAGIGEEDMLTIVLPYIHSAREGVIRLGGLLEQYGTYEMNGIGFQDDKEIWWLESVGGHHWIAKRVPDDSYVVMPNQQGIDWFDFEDAAGSRVNHMCSADLADFIALNHLDLTMQPDMRHFDVRAALGSHTESDHVYNTPRAWYMLRYFNRKSCRWDGPEAEYGPEADDLPWSMVPERRITIDDIKYILSSYYQETPFDPYSRYSDPHMKAKYRPIGINRNNFVAITQIRPYVPKEIAALEWIAEGSNAFNAMIPFYANTLEAPAYLANTCAAVTTENFYWTSRLIGALADAHYGSCIVPIEHYQAKMQQAGYNLVAETDSGAAGAEDLHAYLAAQNQKAADTAQAMTAEVLGQILHIASNGMKNAFSRNDG